MKKLLTGISSILLCISVQANALIIQPKFTTSFKFQATDVWNIDVQLSTAKPVNVFFEATITGKGNNVLATLRSRIVTISPGLQSFNSVSMSTAQLQYISKEISDIEALTGSFPSGNYKVCYVVKCQTPDCDGNGSDAVNSENPECFELVVEPPTPLLLAFPEDKAILEWTRPTFNWIPPMPLSSLNGFNYIYTLVESRKGQKCMDAIVRNRPIYKQSGIEMPTLPYPAELNDLDTGITYCWKVDGLVGDIPVAQSEVWEFKLKGEEKIKHKIVAIKPGFSLGLGSYTLNQLDTIKIVFDQQYQSNQEKWTITLRPEIKTDPDDLSSIVLNPKYQGLSHILILPSDVRGLKPATSYILEIQSEKHEKYLARVLFSK